MKITMGVACMILIGLLQLGIVIAAVRRKDWPQVVVYGGFLIAQSGLIWIAVQRNL